MTIDITDEFLEFVKKCPSEMIRTTYSMYYEVEMTWVVDKTTVKILLRDNGSFREDKNPSIALMRIAISKKRFYNLFTTEKVINHTQVHKDQVHSLYDAIKGHYFDHTEWSPRNTDSISKYL